MYDTLREQVASALKGAILLDQVLTHERRLQVAVARRTAELTSANAELTREVERRMRLEREVSEISNRTMQRIGQDLHDDLCQHLAGIAMLASVLRGTLTDTAPAAVASVEQIGTLLSDSITRAKQIARGLYPAGLEENGLVATLEELVDAARRNYAAAIEFRAAPDFRLPGTDRALQVYRIVQEALSNALKHSGSERIEVKLYREEAQPPAVRRPGRDAEERRSVLVAEVNDDGEGIPATVDGNGMGLRIMRYRAETAGRGAAHREAGAGHADLVPNRLFSGRALMGKPVTFLVVDDHPVFRQGLVALIKSNERYQVCGEAGTVAETLSALEHAVPDIALVDISLVGQNGLDLVKTLKAAHPDVLVLIISMHDEVVYAERALKAGARGYVMKQEAASVMLDAIETVLSGKIYVSAVMRDRLLETMFSRREEAESPSVERLSDRELEVLELIGQGYGAAETAKVMNLSVKTVNAYSDHIKEKLQIAGAGALRRFAVKWVQSRDR